jgi:uncharacterized membrane protein
VYKPRAYVSQDESHADRRAATTEFHAAGKVFSEAHERGFVILLRPIHPLQAVLLAGALPLFLGVLFNDLAYARSYEVQWKNFASWLLVGGLAVSFIALAWAIADFARLSHDRGVRRLIYLALLLAMWILGFVNALAHAGDVWASMPESLILSAIVALLSIATVWLGFSNYRMRVPP